MIRILVALILAAILALIGYWFYLNPGVMMIHWLGYEFRFPVFVVLFGLLLLSVVVTFFYRTLVWLFCLPFKASKKWREHQKIKGEDELLQLASAVAVENVPAALKHAKKAKSTMSERPFYWWFTSQAQALSKKHVEEAKSLSRLLEKAPVLALKGQVEAAIEREDRQSAYEYLEKLKELDPKSPWVLQNLLALYKQCKKYPEAEEVINTLEDMNYLTKGQAKRQLAGLYELMIDDPQLGGQVKEEALRKAHYLDPSLVHVTEEYAQLMMKQGHETAALTALKATWKVAPTEGIGDLYVALQKPATPMAGYELTQKLVAATATKPLSKLLTAKYALQAKLWGEARKGLTQLEKKAPSRQVYQLLAKLEIKENNNLKAALDWAMKGYDL